jgi:hypothetical protein
MTAARLGMAAVVLATLYGCTNRAPKTLDASAPRILSSEFVCEIENSRLSQDARACALPTAEQIAVECAVHDRISSPDFKIPDEEEEVTPKPLPEYRVSDLACTYDTPEQKQSTCSFGLALPGEAVGKRKVSIKLGYSKWSHNTPLTFSYGWRWSSRDDCTPENPKGP